MDNLFNWLDREATLTSAALTVRAQARAALDVGKTYHPIFFPRVDTDSIKIAQMITSEHRVAADRREWNTLGRLITRLGPGFRDIEMIPIEMYDKIEERELQELLGPVQGNQALLRDAIGPQIPRRVDDMVDANIRRIEIDAIRAWVLGVITVRNPQGAAADRVIDLQIDTNRYVAPTPWTGGSSGTAWAGLMAELAASLEFLSGGFRGVALRLSTMNAIAESAPLATGTGQISPVSRRELERRVVDQFGGEFSFNVIEDTVKEYVDGGAETQTNKLWPAEQVAVIPAGTVVGRTYYAPVVRAYGLAQANPDAQIDVRGMTVVRDVQNSGRELKIEVQVNALAVPEEENVYVIDAGI